MESLGRGRRAKEVKRSWGESAASNRPDDGVWGHGWAVAGLVSDQSRGEEQLCSSICPFYVPPSTGWEETIVRTWSIPYGNCEKKRRDMCSFSICSMNHDGIDISFLTLLSINYRKRRIFYNSKNFRNWRGNFFGFSIEISNFICYEKEKKKRRKEKRTEMLISVAINYIFRPPSTRIIKQGSLERWGFFQSLDL